MGAAGGLRAVVFQGAGGGGSLAVGAGSAGILGPGVTPIAIEEHGNGSFLGLSRGQVVLVLEVGSAIARAADKRLVVCTAGVIDGIADVIGPAIEAVTAIDFRTRRGHVTPLGMSG